jgi:hypothetical protein
MFGDLEEPYDKKWNSTGNILYLVVFGASSFISLLLSDALGIPFWLSFAAIILFGMLSEYWLPPRPPASFATHAAKAISIVAAMILSIWIVPEFLENRIWKPLAYALPILILCSLLYFIKPFYSVKNRNITFKQWFLFVAIFAVGY